MKLRINGLENELTFEENKCNVLVCKDKKLFRHLIEVLNDKVNGLDSNEIFLLDDNNEEIRIDKEVFMIIDIFNIDYNSKKILNKIYEIISNRVEMTKEIEMNDIIIKLRNYLIEEINEMPFEFIMKDELDVKEILKLFDLKIDKESYTNIIEKIELLIDIISTLNVASVLVIPNMKAYLSDEEIVEIYKYSLYNNVKLLSIEKDFSSKLEYENILLIDENFDETLL